MKTFWWKIFGIGFAFAASLQAEDPAASAAALPPAAVVGLFSQLQSQVEIMKNAYTVSVGEVPRFTEASVAAGKFGEWVQQVPKQAQTLPAEKQAVVERDVRRLASLAALVGKYARQSDAISETQKFMRQLQTNFEELKAQFPSAWFAKSSRE